jgi:macrolide transport system ATP-binding/permease protein
VIELKGISKKYRMGDTVVAALDGVSLRVEQGEYVAIMGPSGSGKSTLMNMLGLLDTPTSGSYQIDGREVSLLTELELAELRRKTVGFVFQQFHLLPRMSAAENVCLPLIYSEGRLDPARATELLEWVGMSKRAHHRPNELSGGQQQRVAIARSLMNRPRLILADEPTGNLDSSSEREIMQLLHELNEQGTTVVIVTHEEEIGRKAKRLIRMRDGVVQSDIRASEGARERKLPLENAKTSGGPGVIGRLSMILYFKEGFKTLLANKVRTCLSLLGLMIGVASVVAMLAIGRGAQVSVERRIATLGANLLLLQSGPPRAGRVMLDQGGSQLRLEDARAVEEKIREQISAGSRVTAVSRARAQVTFRNRNSNNAVLGTFSSYAEIHSLTLVAGRFYTDEESDSRSRVAVLGSAVAHELFGEANPVGEQIKINKVGFEVIGVLAPRGGGQEAADYVILAPVQTVMKRIKASDFIELVEVQVEDSSQIEETQARILEVALARHKVPPSREKDAFHVSTMTNLIENLSESSRTMTMLLACIAAISLIVGGIGVMNIMLVTVTERTREIGLRKAVGASQLDILLQFLAESIVICSTGGALGVLLGWVSARTIAWSAGWPTAVTLSSVLLSFGATALVGILFGIYPARKASLLRPIDALRYE